MKNAGAMKLEARGEQEIVITRSFAASPEMVFDAWTKPALLKRWMGTMSGWSWKTCKIDLRVGGAYRWVWREESSGKEMGMGGVYREIVRPDRLVATERFDEAWYPGDGLQTVVFSRQAAGTLMTMTVRYDSREARDGVIKSPMEGGLAQGFAKLDQLVAERKGADVQKVAFTMVPVKNAERARGFYEKTLGLIRGSASPDGVWTEYDLPQGGCLALFMGPNASPTAEGTSVAFEVADLDGLSKRLESEGVRFQAKGIESPVCRMNVILDSEGNSLILHQLHRPI